MCICMCVDACKQAACQPVVHLDKRAVAGMCVHVVKCALAVFMRDVAVYAQRTI